MKKNKSKNPKQHRKDRQKQKINLQVKININFLDKYLYLQDVRSNVVELSDGRGYFYRTSLKIATPVDMLFLVYLLAKAQERGKATIEISIAEMLRYCGKWDDGYSYKRIRQFLDSLKGIQLDFEDCFYENGTRISKSFRIIDHWSEDYGILVVVFNQQFFQANQSKYSSVIPLEYYVTYRSMTMRLYEIIAPKFYSLNNDTWEIFLMRLAEKIPLQVRKASDVWNKIKLILPELKKILPWLTWEVIGRGKSRKIIFAREQGLREEINLVAKQQPANEQSTTTVST